ncbi:MAG: bifunctional methylenetetrahydrofolate dehydrogenase/methenyltetrahydrofolate cyclohydrolase FolD [Candidatus Moranbacteria bacterium CG23_combo_of_CG06-09_8_20_14_all_35_22]|nr:MAG: bifunctional methylenetetrahydrofolate dehydrogenase/methenyltetrahydrofolate cyclohydrolase FolD [Candidatus Moranbacteria bacterium CG23_combo_of_CG06-09_8_20_14_all_35_22]
MKILDGKKLAEEIKKELKVEVLELKKNGIVPGLAVVMVGDDEASKIYVENKKRACEEIGINSEVYELEEKTEEEKLLKLIGKLNKDETVSGILVQLPLPKQIDKEKIILAIDPKKDVDCFHPENIGKIFLGLGQEKFFPCTPAGILEILKRSEIEIIGKDSVIVGRSNIVGKPLALMMINAGATVTVCNSKTKNLKEKCLGADILISAVGHAGLITADMIKQGAVVVDVGMNRNKEGKLVGDVDFLQVSKIASAITPVPGGVGLMTVAMLLCNTLRATKLANK